MSTNIDTGKLPDTDVLEQLANQFFRALPGSNPQDILRNPQGSGKDVPDPLPGEYSRPNPAATPAEVVTKVPMSVAGSGVSPSAPDSNKAFDVKDPQTSLPDPHFSDGRVPSSVAGSGRSPSTQAPSQALPLQSSTPLPYASESSYGDMGLKEVLTGITSFTHLPQIPFPSANESP